MLESLVPGDISDELQQKASETARKLIEELATIEDSERGHAERVAVYSVAIGQSLGFDVPRLTNLRYAAYLHDIGFIKLPEGGKWMDHADLGANLLSKKLMFAHLAEFVRSHHENMDGTGYPSGISGDEIPLESRIIRVAESFDTLTHSRGWNHPVSEDEAISRLKLQSGQLFDKAVVQALVRVLPKIIPMNEF